jgi:hypothetical protein
MSLPPFYQLALSSLALDTQHPTQHQESISVKLEVSIKLCYEENRECLSSQHENTNRTSNLFEGSK